MPPKSSKKTHIVCGVVEFISYEEYAKEGYLKNIEQHPVLIYQMNGDDRIYWKSSETNKYMYVYDYMIKKRYSIQEAQDAFPELFL